MDYRQIIESRYSRKNWQGLLFDIFRNKVQFWQQPQQVPVNESMAKSAVYTGKINLVDGHTIAIYEVELSDNIVIERNRAGIRNLLCSNWRGMGCAGAFMFCYRQHEAVLRFSYVSEAFVFSEDGSLKKDSTDTKRFTYLLGEGHRSRTAIQQFEELKKSALDLKAITKAFSVEALSDLFFKEYKKQYEDIVEFVTGKRMVKVANKWEERVTGQSCREIMQAFAHFPDAEKAVRDYVKKLMGRLVFIQFLQKKGWMGCTVGEDWNDGDREFVQNLFANSTHKNSFVDDVLEPLFNDINTRREGDIANAVLGKNIKVPYLNGGLFEKDEFDKTAFPLPAKYMKSMLDFFASYNFTIDENDPDDAEIGVDPEMLGRIFENLLEDNKDKGAFYTPKEIVQYMCRESLIAYLQTDVEDEQTKDAIRQFVTTYNASVLSDELKENVDQKLKDVKICDPAIGSGAFPMGLLRELYACRKAIEGIDNDNAVRIKTHIIQNNIYGVDIEKGAVDIARLRFWLALIVDETTPHALPNMDFKIMQGNSLLEQYEGVELSGMSLDEQKKRNTKKGDAYQTSFAFDEQLALDNIQKAIKQYYLTDNHDAKVSLRQTIDDNVKSYILNLKGFTPDIQHKLENLPIPNDKFFLWHIYFKEVFDKGGFDIVIGNPPYIRQEKLGMDYKKLLTTVYPNVGNGTADIFVYFFGLGFNLLCNKGVLAFITSNKFLKTQYGQGLRKSLANEMDVKLFIDFFELPVFQNASTDAGITILTKEPPVSETKYYPVKTLDNLNLFDLTSKTHLSTIKDESEWKFVKAEEISIMTKMYKDTVSLEVYSSGKMYIGIKTGLNKAFILKDRSLSATLLNSESAPIIKRYAEPKDIKQWKINNDDKYIIATGFDIDVPYLYPSVMKHLDKFKDELMTRGDQGRNYYNLRACSYYDELAKPKLIYIYTAKNHQFYLDLEGRYVNNSCFMIISGNRFLFSFLNSNLFKWFKKKKFVAYGDGEEDGRCKLDYNKMATVPIKLNVDEAPFAEIVDRVKNKITKNPNYDTTAEEREIDRLVYDLYNLTEEEINIIESS